MKEKVILGLSGGVDSAVSAYLLKEQGYEVIGVFLDAELAPFKDALNVANTVGIEFIRYDFKEILEENVCKYFVDEYLQGRTPNPCIMCNPTTKFKILCEFAEKYNASYIATGHYLKTGYAEFDGIKTKVIKKSDSNKDQSYMLCRLTQDVIDKIIFPLCDFKTKDEVRQKAREIGLSVAEKPDSMEICFVPKNHTEYIESRGHSLEKGNFVDSKGNILGEHKGIHNYTVGQRRGLGVSHTSRLFIHKIDPIKNEIILSDEDIFMDKITISNTSFAVNKFFGTDFRASVKVRYSKNEEMALISSKIDGRCEITFEKPVRAPASGQSAVFYIDNILIGGGFIDG